MGGGGRGTGELGRGGARGGRGGEAEIGGKSSPRDEDDELLFASFSSLTAAATSPATNNKNRGS